MSLWPVVGYSNDTPVQKVKEGEANLKMYEKA